ncbi:ribonuclease HII [Candidatus Woesearchaeota archaeon]|nr:ribonuclease HII [Candidatus Woesearchaeota archaeon]
MIIAIDESNKGTTIGDLVVSGILIDDITEQMSFKYSKTPIKDSKKLSRKQRELAFPEIIRLAYDTKMVFIKPSEMEEENLNKLEAMAVAEIVSHFVERVGAGTITAVYIDNYEISKEHFFKRLKELTPELCGIPESKWVVEHKADENYLCVGAASIVSRVMSDMQHDRYRHVFGDYGSGCASDAKTKKFIRDRIDDLPRIVRKSWGNVRRIKEESMRRFE